LETSLPA